MDLRAVKSAAAARKKSAGRGKAKAASILMRVSGSSTANRDPRTLWLTVSLTFVTIVTVVTIGRRSSRATSGRR
jgi:hypothetical protein